VEAGSTAPLKILMVVKRRSNPRPSDYPTGREGA
jgi:hypothetical protein